jgi:hypothetical protein
MKLIVLQFELSFCFFLSPPYTWSDKVRELYIRGIVHYEFVTTGQTVNQVYYLEVLKRLREKLDGNDPNFLTTHGSCITTMHLLTRHCL